MSATLEQFEDHFLHCELCSGESDRFINIDGTMVCAGCLFGKVECCE